MLQYTPSTIKKLKNFYFEVSVTWGELGWVTDFRWDRKKSSNIDKWYFNAILNIKINAEIHNEQNINNLNLVSNSSFCHCDTIPKKISWKKARFIMAHGFRGERSAASFSLGMMKTTMTVGECSAEDCLSHGGQEAEEA
jgi:hypothetical protein